MKQIAFKYFYLLLLIFSPFFSSAYYNSDYGSISGNWSNTGSWLIYSNGSWISASAIPSASDTVYILNGTTMLMDEAFAPCYRLTVENGASLYAGDNGGSPLFIDLYGDSLTCNGIIGNANLTTYDGISFDIQAINCIISGSGSFNGSHIRKWVNVGAPSSVSNLTIGMNITLCFGDTTNVGGKPNSNTSIYNHTNNTVFNIYFAAGTVTNLIRHTGTYSCTTNLSIAGSDGAQSTRSGTYTINGEVIVSGSTIFSTMASTGYHSAWVINSGGILKTNDVITGSQCGGSCAGGCSVIMNSGGLMQITATPFTSVFSLINNTYNLLPGSTIEYAGSGRQNIDVNVTYANLTLSGSGEKTASSGAINIRGDLTINNQDTLVPDNIINISGNWNDYSKTGFLENGVSGFVVSSVTFKGNSDQTITVPGGESFVNVTINKSSGYINLDSATNSSMIIEDTLNFISGIIRADSSDAGYNVVNFINPTSIALGANDNSFVSGLVKRRGSSPFIYPVGKGSEYRPVTIGTLTKNQTIWAQYFNQNPYDGAPVPAHYDPSQFNSPIDQVSTCEFWTLESLSSDVADSVCLSWDTYSCPITDPSGLLIATRDSSGASKWTSLGNGGTTGTTVQGAISSSSSVAFNGNINVYTLATNASALPVSLLSFNAKAVQDNALLNWTTASEINNDYFNIEKTADGYEFVNVGQVKGSGTTTSEINYSFVDKNPFKGISYYRLKQTDYNGNYTYSQLAAVNFTTRQTTMITLFPNPTSGRAYINLSWESMPQTNVKNKIYTLHVFDVSGREAMPQQVICFSYGMLQALDVTSLPKGSYMIQLNADTDVQRTSLVKE